MAWADYQRRADDLGESPCSIAGVVPSLLGFGAAPIGNLYDAVDDDQALSAVRHAYDQGIRYFDTAPYYGYGLSEDRLGRALQGCGRSSFVLSSKVGRLIQDAPQASSVNDGFAVHGRKAVFDYSREGVRRCVEASLQRLKSDYIDILLVHDVGALTHGSDHPRILQQTLEQALPELARLKQENVCRAIGIGVNESDVCLEVMARFPLDCIMLAGRYTLLEQSAGLTVLNEAKRRGVRVLAAGPYNSGLLSSACAPGGTYNYRAADMQTRQRAEHLYKVCTDAGVEVGSAALQFPLAHPAVSCVVAGMRSVSEVDSALARAKARVPPSAWLSLREAGLLLPEAPTP